VQRIAGAKGKEADGRPLNCFSGGAWKVFLDADDVPRAVHSVEENPIKEGKPRQRWPFVVPHDGARFAVRRG